MTKKISYALAVLALAVAGSANAAIVDNWHNISSAEHESFGNDFSHETYFSDTYLFSLSNGVNALSGSIDIDDPFSKYDLDLSSVSIWSWSHGSLLDRLFIDYSPEAFSFTGLLAGSYAFVVSGEVDKERNGWNVPVSYDGDVYFKKNPTSVPEPGALTLAGLGLLGFALVARRRLFG
jgi:hypothetical protein